MQQNKIIKDNLALYWDNFIAGDDDALSEVYEKTYRNLFSFGKTLSPDTELVKDCTQDVFVWLLQKRAHLASVKNIKVYLLNALKNTMLDAFKKQHVYRKFMDSYDLDDPIDVSAEEQIIAQERDMALQNLTAKYKLALTKRQQEIIHYRFVEELTIEEIATLLNINYQSVANTIQRSVKKIRNLYQKTEYKN